MAGSITHTLVPAPPSYSAPMGTAYCGCAIRLLPGQTNRHGRAERSALPATPQGVTRLVGAGERVGHGGQFPQLGREGLTRIGIKAGDGLGPGKLRIPLGKVDDRFARAVMGEANDHGSRCYHLADVGRNIHDDAVRFSPENGIAHLVFPLPGVVEWRN